MMKKFLFLLIFFLTLFPVLADTAGKSGGFTVSCVPESHFAAVGEEIRFTVTSETKMPCRIVLTLDGGKVLKSLNNVIPPQSLTYIPEKPGFIRCSVRAKNVKADCAVAVSPEKISAVGKEPADFDEFWKKTFEESARIPLDMQTVKLDYKGDFDYYRLSCANINGKRAYALLAIPGGITSPVPLLVHFGGGDAYASEDILRWFANTAVRNLKRKTAVLIFHLPPYQPVAKNKDMKSRHKEFLKELGGARRYIVWKDSFTSKETFYARSALTGCVRLLEYTAQLKEIDSDKIIFKGASHGGKFGAYLCCFSNRIKAAFCGVPSSCEFHALLDGRKSSVVREWKTHLDIINYYDLVWCARRIKCPVLVSVGFVDDFCPPTGVYAFYNELKSPKQLYNKVDYGHSGEPVDYNSTVWKFLADSLEK